MAYHFLPTTTSKTTARRRARKYEAETTMHEAGCARCGTHDRPMVGDHHGDGVSAKSAGVMALIDADASEARVSAEWAKVRVLCIDCHHYRTFCQGLKVPVWDHVSEAEDKATYLNIKRLLAEGYDLHWME